jgi:hypothetical protein
MIMEESRTLVCISKFSRAGESLSPELPTTQSCVLKSVRQLSPRPEAREVQVGALHSLQIWLPALGICNIKDKHADLK